jgi:hypothetical protein
VRLDRLGIANLAFVAAILLHGADHLRQGRTLAPEVLWGGTALAIVAFATLPLTLARHPRAPQAAVAVGLWTAIAVSASHLAPHWSAFSDPYAAHSLDLWSWAAMLLEIAAALAFAAAGVAALSAGPRASAAPSRRRGAPT